MSEMMSPIEEFKSVVVAKAAEVIVLEMTAEKLKPLVEQTFAQILGSIKTDKYSDFHGQIQKQVNLLLAAHLATPEVREQMQAAIKTGVEDALKALPGAVRGKVTDLALEGLGKALSAENTRRW